MLGWLFGSNKDNAWTGTESVPASTDWVQLKSGHATAAAKAGGRGDHKAAAEHQRLQRWAARQARESGKWWIHA